jgi:mannitol/fructose-specific phosphotransferase system IIA component (Ntr-type)
MDFEDFFGPGVNVVDLRAQDRWQAIEELLNHLVANRMIPTEHRDSIARSVRRRESGMSTGIGFGIGIPHASTELVPEVVAMVGRSRKGIQFDALDGKPVHLVLLFLVPAGQFQKHVNTLANIAKLLHRQDFRDGLWGRFM